MNKVKVALLFILLLFILIFPCDTFAQQDPLDPYGPDSVLFEQRCSYIDSSSCSGTVVISVILENDEPSEDPVAAFAFPFYWTGPAFLDSVSYVGTKAQKLHIKDAIIDSVNNTVICIGLAYYIPGIEPGRGSVSELFFSGIDTGIVTIDTTHIDPYYFGLSTFFAAGFTPQFEKGAFHLVPSYLMPGDVNLDDSVNLSDAIYLAHYLLKSGPEPGYFPCSYTNVDINSDCKINLGDVVYLANYLLKGGPAP